MKNKCILDFEIPCKKYTCLNSYRLGKEIRKYFEDLGADLKDIEEKRIIICYIPDNIKHVSKSFVDGFLGDRIKENGVKIFLKYNVFSNNNSILRTIYENMKELICKYMAK
jgi:hypothetical protein